VGFYPCPRRICLHKDQVLEWCTGIPAWAAIAMFHMAAKGFAFALFLRICMCVSVWCVSVWCVSVWCVLCGVCLCGVCLCGVCLCGVCMDAYLFAM